MTATAHKLPLVVSENPAPLLEIVQISGEMRYRFVYISKWRVRSTIQLSDEIFSRWIKPMVNAGQVFTVAQKGIVYQQVSEREQAQGFFPSNVYEYEITTETDSS